MSSCGEQEKAMIFSEENWNKCERNQKIRILKAWVKEIAHDLGVRGTPRLIISKDTHILGAYRLTKNTLILSELMAIEGKKILVKVSDKKQVLVSDIRTTNFNSNTDTIFAVCHEIEHAAQYQRVCGKIAWCENDDIEGILVNMQQKTDDAILPYINGNIRTENDYAYDLYQAQPVEYGANQRALKEMYKLMEKYKKYCSADEMNVTFRKIRKKDEQINDLTDISNTYGTSHIVQDISRCLQNIFTGTQYHVPPELRQDVEDACRASYQYMYSEQYMQREALLKKEINYELAKQEYER